MGSSATACFSGPELKTLIDVGDKRGLLPYRFAERLPSEPDSEERAKETVEWFKSELALVRFP